VSTDCLVMQEWGIDRKHIDRDSKNAIFRRRKLKFLLQEPWNSVEHKVRNSIILPFTFFSTRQLEKLIFSSTDKRSDARVRHQKKPIGDRFQKYNYRLAQIQVSATGALKSNTPIEHKVRNGIILTFTSCSITQLKKLAFYVHGPSGYVRMMHRQKAYGR
jgi:hypothetical protein